MPSISSILSVGYQALSVSQNGINVTSHNIANASTEGYTRQKAIIQANPTVYFPYGALGTGAAVVDVARMRDQFVDETFRRENSVAAFTESRNGMLRRLEGFLSEPGDLGVSAKLDNFFNVWSELSANPTDSTVRNVVRQSGQELADTFQGLSTQIDQLRQEGEARLNEFVARVNQIVEDIRDLNRNIVTVEAGGITATDLRDQRDRSVDELSSLLNIQVNEREDGSIGVSFQGYSIADRDTFTRIELRFSAGTAGIGIEGRTGLVPTQGGRIGGTLKVLNDDLGGARQQLDDLAAALVAEVNAAHGTGTSPNGATGIDFFDPAGVTASSITLSSDILASLDNLAAATGDGTGAYRAGANDVALAIAGFNDQASGILGETFASRYRGLVSGIGVALESSTDVGTVAQTLAQNAASRRDALSGVSTDEELVNLIRYQTAYQAAARIITTADEMLQTILSI